MFYETAQTIGPGWHRSFKPSHYDDMTWSPSSKHFRSPGSSPETYRRIIHTEEDFPKRTKENDEDFFSGRRSPTFPRRIFKEVWSESPTSNHRFADRPRLFKRVFKPDHWDDDFERNIPHIRRVERNFDHDFDDGRPMSRNFEEEFDKRFNARDLKKDMEEEFQKAAEGRVHHIPIMVEKRMEEMKSRFGRNNSPPPEPECANEEEYAEEWAGPQVQNLRRNFEPEDNFSSKYRHRYPKIDVDSRSRAFATPVSDTWDPHAVHTLPTRKAHKNSQSFDDSRHPVTPKSVFRSFSETHEDVPRQQPQHSAAFRSHSDGHCPKQTYVTKIEVNLPSQKEKEELRSRYGDKNQQETNKENVQNFPNPETNDQASETIDDHNTKPKMKSKHENPSLQQIAVILQNVEDLVLRVEAYNGTGRDKQFRFLDEMLTRCMLRLDDVDTEGREDIRSARKAAVREVQSCIDKLEAKADESERRYMQQQLESYQQSSEQTDCTQKKDDSENKDNERVSDNQEQKVEQNDLSKQGKEQKSSKEEVTNIGVNEQTKL